MDQGNTDPNNPTPNNPVPPPATPVAPPPVSDAGASNWANPTTPVVQPPVAESPAMGGLAAMPPQQEANPFNSPVAAPPTTFNPFSSPTAGSTPPTPEPFPPSPEPAPSEAVPTDLSNLVNTTSEATNYIPQSQTPESLVVPPPQTSGGDVNQAVPASGGKGFPKIAIILGVIILLAVIGASAYFILGIGKPSEPLPVSVPAEQQSAPTPVTKAPVVPTATQSGTFSNLPGNPTVTPATGGSKSAYETLMQQKKTATGSATP